MNFTARMVRELKGAPLSCLILIAIAGPVSNEWLCRMSGYTDKPISQALKLLSSPEYQLIVRGRGGWVLAEREQYALSEPTEPLPESRNNSDSAAAFKLINLKTESINTVAASRKNSDSRYYANLEACTKAGIFNSVAEQLSELDHVTPELIAAHKADLKKGEGVGLAIRRIQNNEMPASWQKAEEQADEEECQRNKYTTGSFSDYLE